MANYLPVRAFNRSQKVRIAGQQLSPEETKYVNADDRKVQRDWARHSAIGAVVVVGVPVVEGQVRGGVVTAGNGLDVNVSGGFWVTDDEAGVYFSEATVTLDDADGDNPRIDRIVVEEDGSVSAVKGTPASTPSAPNAPADSISLATVAVAAQATDVGTITDTRPGFSL